MKPPRNVKLRCSGGPWDYRKVSSHLEERWPYVVAYDDNEMLLTWYEYRPDLCKYVWTGERESVRVTKRANVETATNSEESSS